MLSRLRRLAARLASREVAALRQAVLLRDAAVLAHEEAAAAASRRLEAAVAAFERDAQYADEAAEFLRHLVGAMVLQQRRESIAVSADMLEAAERAIRYVRGMTRAAFGADEKTIDAVVRNLEILGEAAKHVPHPYGSGS